MEVQITRILTLHMMLIKHTHMLFDYGGSYGNQKYKNIR